jgi:hypothetical protein
MLESRVRVFLRLQDQVVGRAFEIARKMNELGFRGIFIGEGTRCVISDEVTFEWLENRVMNCLEGHIIESFPLEYLWMGDDWIEVERQIVREREKKNTCLLAIEHAKKEAAERKELERLKAKYG